MPASSSRSVRRTTGPPVAVPGSWLSTPLIMRRSKKPSMAWTSYGGRYPSRMAIPELAGVRPVHFQKPSGHSRLTEHHFLFRPRGSPPLPHSPLKSPEVSGLQSTPGSCRQELEQRLGFQLRGIGQHRAGLGPHSGQRIGPCPPPVGPSQLFRRRLALQILPGRLAIDPRLQGTDVHVVGTGKLPPEPHALLLGDHLAACPKTNGHSPAVRLRRTYR